MQAADEPVEPTEIPLDKLEKAVWDFPHGCNEGKRQFINFVKDAMRIARRKPNPMNHRIKIEFEVEVREEAYRHRYGTHYPINDIGLASTFERHINGAIINNFGRDWVVAKDVTVTKLDPDFPQEQDAIARDAQGRFVRKEVG